MLYFAFFTWIPNRKLKIFINLIYQPKIKLLLPPGGLWTLIEVFSVYWFEYWLGSLEITFLDEKLLLFGFLPWLVSFLHKYNLLPIIIVVISNEKLLFWSLIYFYTRSPLCFWLWWRFSLVLQIFTMLLYGSVYCIRHLIIFAYLLTILFIGIIRPFH